MILNRFTTFIIIEMFPSPFVFDCRVYIMASTTWLFQVIKQHPLVHALLCFNATMPHYIPQPTVYPRRFWVYMTSYESRIGFDSNRDPKSPNLILRYRRTPTSTFGGVFTAYTLGYRCLTSGRPFGKERGTLSASIQTVCFYAFFFLWRKASSKGINVRYEHKIKHNWESVYILQMK